MSLSSTDQAGAATAAVRQSMLIVDAGPRDVDETPAAAADVTFSSLIAESLPIGAVKFTSSPRPHNKTASLSTKLWRCGVRFLRRV